MKAAQEVEKRLVAAGRVAIDAGPFLLYLQGDIRHQALTLALFEAVEQGRVEALTSVLTLSELLLAPYQSRDDGAVQEINFLLPTFPHLELIGVDRAIADRAAAWRARHGLEPTAALQAATALLAGAGLFVTTDRRLECLRNEIDVQILADWL